MEPTPKPEQTPKTESPETPKAKTPTPPVPTLQAEPQPPQATPQYIITHRSLEGVSGWLAFWLVLFTLGAITFIFSFFAQISGEAGVETRVVDLIFAPILAVLYVTSIILIVMRKKLGRWVAIASFVTSGLYSMINALITPNQPPAAVIAGILVLWLLVGLFSLYFLKSERVRQTLTK